MGEREAVSGPAPGVLPTVVSLLMPMGGCRADSSVREILVIRHFPQDACGHNRSTGSWRQPARVEAGLLCLLEDQTAPPLPQEVLNRPGTGPWPGTLRAGLPRGGPHLEHSLQPGGFLLLPRFSPLYQLPSWVY